MNCTNCGNIISYGGPPCCDGGKAKRERAALAEKARGERLLQLVDEKLYKLLKRLDLLTERVQKVEQKLERLEGHEDGYVANKDEQCTYSGALPMCNKNGCPRHHPIRCLSKKGDLQCLSKKGHEGGHIYEGAETCPEHVIASRKIGDLKLSPKKFRELVDEGQRLRRTFDAKAEGRKSRKVCSFCGHPTNSFACDSSHHER